MSAPHQFHDADALRALLASRLAAGLSQQAAALPHDIGERLRVAREQAVARARQVRATEPVAAGAVSGVVLGAARGSSALLGGGVPWWMRMASVLPLLVLACGLIVIDHSNSREQVVAAADLDAVLLADDLPPAAYTDPGFAEYLKSPPP